MILRWIINFIVMILKRSEKKSLKNLIEIRSCNGQDYRASQLILNLLSKFSVFRAIKSSYYRNSKVISIDKYSLLIS